MYHMASLYERANDTDSMLKWLQIASAAGNGQASYRLYRIFNGTRRHLLDAIKYRSLARQQGYVSPPTLRTAR
jgi:hypothetical protein